MRHEQNVILQRVKGLESWNVVLKTET